jgi:hypothetical protein
MFPDQPGVNPGLALGETTKETQAKEVGVGRSPGQSPATFHYTPSIFNLP